MWDYFEYDEILTTPFLKNIWNTFWLHELQKVIFRLTNEILNLSNLFLNSFALAICPLLLSNYHPYIGWKKILCSFNFVDEIGGENIFKWSSLLLNFLMILSFCSSAKQKSVTSCTIACPKSFSLPKYGKP